MDLVKNALAETAFLPPVNRSKSCVNRRSCSNAELRAEALAVDEKGRLYTSTDGGIAVFTAAGERLGTIPTPIPIQNFAFSGKDRNTIYAVGRGNVYRVSMLAAGYKKRQK